MAHYSTNIGILQTMVSGVPLVLGLRTAILVCVVIWPLIRFWAPVVAAPSGSQEGLGSEAYLDPKSTQNHGPKTSKRARPGIILHTSGVQVYWCTLKGPSTRCRLGTGVANSKAYPKRRHRRQDPSTKQTSRVPPVLSLTSQSCRILLSTWSSGDPKQFVTI